jgi:hypothetical protein
MTEDIGESFLHNAEDRSFNLAGQPGKISRLYIERGVDAAPFGEAVGVPCERRK